MTGGRIVVLGNTGRNFGAGMSGGIVYIYDQLGDFKYKCNMEMVELSSPQEEDAVTIRHLLNQHYLHTQSPLARDVLDNFAVQLKHFVKVMPLEYKRILEQQAQAKKLGLDVESDG
jgi:glutamate synthase domain-containing protein 3